MEQASPRDPRPACRGPAPRRGAAGDSSSPRVVGGLIWAAVAFYTQVAHLRRSARAAGRAHATKSPGTPSRCSPSPEGERGEREQPRGEVPRGRREHDPLDRRGRQDRRGGRGDRPPRHLRDRRQAQLAAHRVREGDGDARSRPRRTWRRPRSPSGSTRRAPSSSCSSRGSGHPDRARELAKRREPARLLEPDGPERLRELAPEGKPISSLWSGRSSTWMPRTRRRGARRVHEGEDARDLIAKREAAAATLRSEQAGLQLEKARLDRLREQLKNCVITAPKKGMVVYANDRRGRFGGGRDRQSQSRRAPWFGRARPSWVAGPRPDAGEGDRPRNPGSTR